MYNFNADNITQQPDGKKLGRSDELGHFGELKKVLSLMFSREIKCFLTQVHSYLDDDVNFLFTLINIRERESPIRSGLLVPT